MHVLPLTFFIFQIFGFWRPPAWKAQLPILIYNIFTVIMFSTVFTFALSEMMSIILTVQNFDDFTENSFMLISIVSACFKTGNLLLERGSLISLSNALLEGIFKYQDEEEERIQEDFNKKARSNTIWYMALIQSSVFMITLQSLLVDIPRKTLPFPAWHPYNYSKIELYLPTYAHQVIGNATSASLHVANDTLITGMMLQICAQLEILKYRITRIPSAVEEAKKEKYIKDVESEVLRNIVQHHSCICQFSKDINETFSIALLTQFSTAALVICSSVYQLSKMALFSPNFIALSLYLTCILVQIFLYCWYGTAVAVKSLDISNTIFDTNWSLLKVEMQKSLLITMIRAKKPIEMKTGRIFTLSIFSFTKIMKASYSAFNFMQQS